MLSIKGSTGGGSFDITNGVIEDLYAADEAVPANTFVEILKYLHDDPENPALANVGNADFDIGNKTIRSIVQLSDNQYLFFSDTAVRLVTITESSASVSGEAQITANSYLFKDAEKASANTAVVAYTTGWANPRSVCFIVTASNNGSVSVSGEIFLTPNVYTIRELKLQHISENALYAFWMYNKSASQNSVYTLSGCGIYVSGNSATIGAADYFVIDDFTGSLPPDIKTQKLSRETVMCAISSSGIVYSIICRISVHDGIPVLEYTSSLSAVNIPISSISYCEFAPVDSFDYLILYSNNGASYAVIASVRSDGSGGTQLQLGSSGVIAQNEDGANAGDPTIRYTVESAARLSSSLFCVSLSESHGVKGSSVVERKDAIAVFVDISTSVVKKSGESLLSNNASVYYGTECLFTTTDGNVVFIGKDELSKSTLYREYILGEFISVVQKSVSKIDGLTRTKATTEQTGKVWLLDSPGIPANQMEGVGVQIDESELINPDYMEE